MKKLIVSDLDDTLLRPDTTIGQYTKEVIAALRAKGYGFTLATGRMFASAKRYVNELSLAGPVISYNGALVTNETGKILAHWPVELQLAKEMLLFAEEEGFYAQIYINDQFYCTELGPESEYYARQTGLAPLPVHMPLSRYITEDPTKVVIITEPARVQEMLPLFSEKYAGRLQFTVSKPSYFEILAPGAGKGTAVRALAASLNVDLADVVAFGDANNDADMLAAAGLGVAVENAREVAKQAAKDTCPSNAEEGVARYLEKHFL